MNKFLFEVSWEVCNKVGGIYTVLKTKLKEVKKQFGENYILIGPMLEHNHHFIEETTPFLQPIEKILRERNISCRLGYWDKEEKPAVILVDYRHRYNIDELLYKFWSEYGVDSLSSNYEYIEPILFSTAASAVIQVLAETLIPEETRTIAHFHEWLCGAGVLDIKLSSKKIVTAFTTHATVLGRALAGNNINIYDLPPTFDPTEAARTYNVFSKHSLERAAAREADCFTTVSEITADESYLMLNKYPDKIALNGLDIEKIQRFSANYDIGKSRDKLRQIASRVLGRTIPENALLWMTSGRYEFHNKGYDIFLKSLSRLEKTFGEDIPEIVVFFLVAANHHSENESLLKKNLSLDEQQKNALGISTHIVRDPKNDPIISLCNTLNLRGQDQKIHIIYSDAYLNGNDGVFDLSYEEIVASFDLSVFPSYYEPWGYTPPESIAYSTPTITTDTAGFGDWVSRLKEDYLDVVYLLEYKNKNEEFVIVKLCEYLTVIAKQDPSVKEEIRKKTSIIAKMVDWKFFYEDYIDAYNQAIEFNNLYYSQFDDKEEALFTSITELESTTPKFRLFQHECEIPEALNGLRELAYNLWWSWNRDSVKLFKEIDADLWETTGHNPVKFLNSVSHSLLVEKAQNKNYLKKYHKRLKAFDSYCKQSETDTFYNSSLINKEHPIAYFSLEYGLDNNITIYSGGLGILAGDYLKTISDLNIPMIAVGLFYKQGYFTQKLDSQGKQLALYETANPNQLPLKQITDESGKPLLINIELPERTLYISVWKIKVGRLDLYLLDTDLQNNTIYDRQITNKLYGGSREHRLLQEIVLGIGGTRFILEKLEIQPSLFHLNEGHSAFLIFERIKHYYNRGIKFDKAAALIRASSVFTTHTSVPAGNEVFSEEIIKKYFANSEQLFGFPLDEVINLSKDVSRHNFSMTVLALRFSAAANAVSKIHQNVAQGMWQPIWKGFLQSEVPIDFVTNGVHLTTWLGRDMKKLYDHSLGADWVKFQDSPKIWHNLFSIPNHVIWETHQKQKEKLLTAIRERVIKEYPLREETEQLTRNTLRCLDNNTLFIGFSRRFATYKRADLILYNQKRLVDILTNSERPVVLVMAGKAHPADIIGQEIISNIIKMMRQEMFNGHIIFLENYNMSLAKLLVQGVDVWLNTPFLNTEACGTSGIKAGLNGGLNFSIKDGWWDEAYSDDSNIGWAIDDYSSQFEFDKQNEMANRAVLDTLENSIVPLYYKNRIDGFNSAWVEKMKASIAYISYQFNTFRMVKDYWEKLYSPIANQSQQLTQNNNEALTALVDWQNNIISRFNTVKIKTILIDGVKDGKIQPDGVIETKVLLFSGKMKAHELKTELVLIKSDGEKFISAPIIVPLKLCDTRESGILTYTGKYDIDDAGFYNYGVRIYPHHPALFHPQNAGIVFWG